MPMPPPSMISLSEARRRVCKAYNCSPEEAEKYLKQELRFGGLTPIDQDRGAIKIYDDTVIDFESSTVTRTRRTMR